MSLLLLSTRTISCHPSQWQLLSTCSQVTSRLIEQYNPHLLFRSVMRSLCFKAKSARSRKFYWTSYPHDCKAELDIDEAMTFPSPAPGGWHFWFLMACLHCCYMDGHVAQPTLFTYLVTRLNCHRCLACVVLNSEGLHRKSFYRITIGLLLKAWKHSASKNRTGFWTQR